MRINNPNSPPEGSNKTSRLSGIVSLAMLTQVAVADTLQVKKTESTRDIPVEELIKMYPNTIKETIQSLSREQRQELIRKGGGEYGINNTVNCTRCHMDPYVSWDNMKKSGVLNGLSRSKKNEKITEILSPLLRTYIHTLKYESPEPLKQKHLEEFAPMYNNNPAKWNSGEYYNVPAAGRLKEGSINTTNGEFRRHIERAFGSSQNFIKLKAYLNYKLEPFENYFKEQEAKK